MTESNALNITFKAFGSGNIASPKLQGWIIEAVEKGTVQGLSGQSLCEHLATHMTNNHGKYWHCFVGKIFSLNDEDPATDNGAWFDLDGESWIVFRSRFVELM